VSTKIKHKNYFRIKLLRSVNFVSIYM